METTLELLNSIYEKFSERYHEISKEIDEDIPFSERDRYYLMIIYKNQAINLTQFSKIAKISKPAGTKIINKYIKKGYVTKETSKTDKRFSYIQLTNKTIEYLNKDKIIVEKIHEEYLSPLNDSEREQLNLFLLKINENMLK